MHFCTQTPSSGRQASSKVRWSTLVGLLLFVLLAQFHAVSHLPGNALGVDYGPASLQAASQADGDPAGPADLCVVCVALNSAHPLPAFSVLPPGGRTRKAGRSIVVFKPDTGWHGPLACRPPPSLAA